MSSRTCSLCSRCQCADQGSLLPVGRFQDPVTIQGRSGQGHPFFTLLVFRIRDVGSQQELDRLEIVVQPLPRGDGRRPGLLGLLLDLQSRQVTDPQQEGARQRQDQQGGDGPDAGGRAQARMPARPFASPFPKRRLGGVLERTDAPTDAGGPRGAPGRSDSAGMARARGNDGRSIRPRARRPGSSAAPPVADGVPHAVPQHASQRAVQLRERMAPGQQLVENDPEAVKVASLVSGACSRSGTPPTARGPCIGNVPPTRAAEALRSNLVSSERLKSSNMGWPSSVSRMLAGFRSLWTMPRPWAWASPSASRTASQRIPST